MRSSTTVFGTPVTWYCAARSGNSVASMADAVTCGLAAARRQARLTAWGQKRQVGVTNTWMPSGRSSASSAATLSSLSGGPAPPATSMALTTDSIS